MKKKQPKARLTGYYWVHWYTFDAEKYERVGYYNSSFGHWKLPGEERTYFDKDFLGVDETRIARFSWSRSNRVALIVAVVCALLNAIWALLHFH